MQVLLYGLQPIVCLGVKAALESAEGGFDTVVPVASEDFHLVQESVDRRTVRLVIIDPTKPDPDAGLTCCRELKSAAHPPYVLAYCGGVSERDFLLYQLSGVDSFVAVQEPPDRLVAAAKETLRGQRVWLLGQYAPAPVRGSARPDLLTPGSRKCCGCCPSGARTARSPAAWASARTP
ncbi:hypothetical protein BN6_54080 [Saccharothrix espanaensis DSM 44229]|uniref:Response regulatory domain-containing protein n=1 Tax=Saccharothrix espanaensis (strain ATCC 51144 / DSM 44229 / JCM 9112 / NBRC 15066 / NRRL 15764) TaxID=1179773 RepID=K0K509_SACES|nr:hypothetical protein BN6_54080 [Saccharothrix espanaensis DSM 44229]